MTMTDTGFDELDEEHEDTASAEGEQEFEPYYDNVGEFVHGFILPMFTWDNYDKIHWCRDWWAHGPALAVFSAMHDSWEQTRLDPPAMAAWWRDVAFPLMDRMTGERGPFRECRLGLHGDKPKHTPDAPLPAHDWPTGLFD